MTIELIENNITLIDMGKRQKLLRKIMDYGLFP